MLGGSVGLLSKILELKKLVGNELLGIVISRHCKYQTQAYLEDGSEEGVVDGLELAAMVGLGLRSNVGLLEHR